MTTSFSVPIAEWLTIDFSANFQSDMKNGVGLNTFSFANTIDLPLDVELTNTVTLKPSGNVITAELYKGFFDEKIGLRASLSFDKDGFAKPDFSVSTGVATKVAGCQVNLNTRISDDTISMTPSINYKIQDDITLSAS